MRISFFEEFPTKDNLKNKIKLIDFPTKLYQEPPVNRRGGMIN